MQMTPTDTDALAAAITEWLRQRLAEAGVQRFVLGLSGGVDSATVCALCSRAAGPDAVLGVIMPAQSTPLDAEHAALVATTFGVPTIEIDLTPVVETFFAAVSRGDDGATSPDAGRERLAIANVKPRLRMTTLYYLANRHDGLVVGTGNKTEARLGYFTKYGDGGVDLLPLIDLYKYEVRALAQALGVPAAIITKPPSAGLWAGQTDEGELGASYEQLDAALMAIDAGAAVTEDPLRARLRGLEQASAHKRSPIPAFRRS
jgi:NAD+ synthase